MKKRIWSLLLVAAMVFSIIPVTALASDPADNLQTAINAAVSNPRQPITEQGVVLNKTAQPVSDSEGDEFEITLEVQSTQTVIQPVTATVLVIDSSDSMGKTGMKAAQNAAISFVNTLHTNANGAVHYVSVVDFHAKADITSGWENVSTDEGQEAIETAVKSIGTAGGTNLDAGFHAAYDLLQQELTVDLPKSNKTVLALTDGDPTRHNHSSSGAWASDYSAKGSSNSGTTQEEYDYTIAGADKLKTVADLYTVYYGKSSDKIRKDGRWKIDGAIKISEFLQTEIATSSAHHYLADDTDALNQAFASIGQAVVEGSTGAGAVVNDPMGTGVQLVQTPTGAVETTAGFTWTLGEPTRTSGSGNTTTYIYELTYRVRLTADYQDGQWHNANGPTTLTLNGTVLDFPIPKLKADRDVWKDAEQTDPADDEDSLTGGDGIPDSQQTVIHYVSEDADKGTVGNALDVITHLETGITEVHGSEASPADGCEFVNWTRGQDIASTAASFAPEAAALTPGTEVTYTAHFTMEAYALLYDMNGGTSTAPVDSNTYHMGDVVTALAEANGTHADHNDYPVIQMGWSAAADPKIYTKDDTAPTLLTQVTFGTADETVYAVWAEDRNQNNIPDVLEDLYQVTYTYSGTVPTGAPEPPVDNQTYLIGETAARKAVPTMAGYVMADGWTAPDGVTVAEDGTFRIPGHVQFSGTWSAAANTPYTVEHYYQIKNADNSFSYPAEPQTVRTDLVGTTGATVNAVPVLKTGYLLDALHPDAVPSGTIQADGSLVLKLYYGLDVIGPNNEPDDIFDMYQAVIQYVSADETMGTTAPVQEVVTLKDGEAFATEQNDVTLAGSTATAKTGYVFEKWSDPDASSILTETIQPTLNLVGGHTYVFTAHFKTEPRIGLTVDKEPWTLNGRSVEGKTLVNVEPGDKIQWRITLENTGEAAVTELKLSDVLTVDGKSDSLAIYDKEGERLGETNSIYLEPGDVEHLFVHYEVKNADKGEILSNTFTAKAQDGTEAEDSDTDNSFRADDKAPVLPVLNKKDHYAYIIGYENGTVRPENSITRAEVATIFFRLLDDDSRAYYWSKTNDFKDISRDDWYNNAISTMARARIITGYPDGSFRPNASITRAEFAAIAARFSDVIYDGRSPFSDVLPTHWANDEIVLAEYLGWITGYPDGTFRPNQPITRAEAMTLINRVLERAVEHEHMLKDMIHWVDNPRSAWYYEAVQEATNSHVYVRLNEKVPGQDFYYEDWHEILENPDWAALERAWSDANDQ